MTRRLNYADSARDDLGQIYAYIADRSDSDEIAQKFVDRIREHCSKLAAMPGTMGTHRPDLRADLRSTPHRGYVIFFRYLDDMLEIVSVLEGHRDVVAHFGRGDDEPL